MKCSDRSFSFSVSRNVSTEKKLNYLFETTKNLPIFIVFSIKAFKIRKHKGNYCDLVKLQTFLFRLGAENNKKKIVHCPVTFVIVCYVKEILRENLYFIWNNFWEMTPEQRIENFTSPRLASSSSSASL